MAKSVCHGHRAPITEQGGFADSWFFWKTTAKFEQTRRAGPVNGRCGGYFAAGTIPLLAMSGDGIIGFGKRHHQMNNRNHDSGEPEPKGLGWLVRCKAGCEGVVHESAPHVGDLCPLCKGEHKDESRIIYCVKIAATDDAVEQLSIEGGLSLEGDVIQAWDVDLGSFLTSVDSEDSDVTQVRRTEELCGSSTVAIESGDGRSAGTPENQEIRGRHEGNSQKNAVSAETMAVRLSEHEQHDRVREELTESQSPADGMRFNKWHVLGLICCAALLLIGGLLTFDIVRAIYSPNDNSTASPILKVFR